MRAGPKDVQQLVCWRWARRTVRAADALVETVPLGQSATLQPMEQEALRCGGPRHLQNSFPTDGVEGGCDVRAIVLPPVGSGLGFAPALACAWASQYNEPGAAVNAAYLHQANELICGATKQALAERIGLSASNWALEPDEIHALAVFSTIQVPVEPRHPLRIILDHETQHESMLKRVERRRRVTLSVIPYGNVSTKLFHDAFCDDEKHRFQFIKEVSPSIEATDSFTLASFPEFDGVRVTRLYCRCGCGKTGTDVASLQELAEAAALWAFLITEPPLYMDAIDCVVDVDLYRQGERVMAKVAAFIKFDVPTSGRGEAYKVYANPLMVSALDGILTLSNPQRARLMLIVQCGSRPASPLINTTWLPIEFPPIVIQRISSFSSSLFQHRSDPQNRRRELRH